MDEKNNIVERYDFRISVLTALLEEIEKLVNEMIEKEKEARRKALLKEIQESTIS